MWQIREHGDARRKGVDLVFSLSPDQVDAIGGDLVPLADAIDTVLVGLAGLRMPHEPQVAEVADGSFEDNQRQAGVHWLERLIRDTGQLHNRLSGILAAAIRRHAEDPAGSYGALARALGIKRPSAQYRRDAVTRKPPSDLERWATSPPAQPYDDSYPTEPAP